jgi:putative endonuclease
MFYVYILRSLKNPIQTYVGFSLNPEKRLIYHNAGQSPHTNKFKPWKISAYFAFAIEEKAHKFEKYLKTSSGVAFRNKRLI